MKSYNLQSVTILERGDGHIEKTATYRAVILSEDNEISLENCAWSALQYFIGENTASYNDYAVAYDRILSPWDSFEL